MNQNKIICYNTFCFTSFCFQSGRKSTLLKEIHRQLKSDLNDRQLT